MIDTSRGINWKSFIFLTVYQIALFISLPFYFYYYPVHASTVIASVILLYLTGLSITAGYHRLFAHRSYRAHPVVEGIILFFGAMAGQSSALRWAYDHRLHHAHVDTDEDPYSIKKGFWYAHYLWILEKPRPIESRVVPDLMKNKLVMFQERHIGKLMLSSNILVYLVLGPLLNDYAGVFFLACWTRLFALHHFTWFINSLAHTWGEKPFSQEQSAVDNYILSMLTFGEGYHNYHHTFANDYRNGIRWYHFDPTKWLIWTLNKLGLASDLKRMSPYAIKKKMVIEHKNLLIEQIKAFWQGKTELEMQVNEMSDRLVSKIAEFNQLNEQYQQLKKMENQAQHMLESLRNEIKKLKRSLREDWRQWARLSRYILHRPQLLSNNTK